MIKNLLIALFLASAFFICADSALAIVDPLKYPNNRFGIHISGESDLINAARLVNSSGGDWGYVTFVITESERDRERWQRAFDQMRQLRLIPIVRIATKSADGIWEKPKKEEINNWAAFLNSLNWVVKNRYVIIYNEPNHSKEWGGEVDAHGYSDILKEFSKKLKAQNEDFFILGAGLDASAPNSTHTMDAEIFYKKMLDKNSDIFDYIDGLSSHSYPNPDFSGSHLDVGRGSIKTFEWEIDLLRSIGLQKELPVFITETGWRHDKGGEIKGAPKDSHVSQEIVGAFQKAWTEPNIVAVTPFILDYKSEPFSIFSWTKSDGTFYDFFEAVRLIRKQNGAPEQTKSGNLLAVFFNPAQSTGSVIRGSALVRNTGQAIWDETTTALVEENQKIAILSNQFLGENQPFSFSLIAFESIAPTTPGLYSLSFSIESEGKKISNSFPYEMFVKKSENLQGGGLFDKILSYIQSFLGP